MTTRLDSVMRGTALAGAVLGGAIAIRRAARPLRKSRPLTRQVMSTPAVTVDGDADAERAAEILASTGVGALPVCDGDGRPVGMLTDRDLVVRVLGQDHEGPGIPVRELAETPPVTTEALAPAAATAETMARHGVRRLPVVAHGRLVGVVSRGDLLMHVPARLARALHRIGRSTPASDRRSGRWAFRRAYA